MKQKQLSVLAASLIAAFAAGTASAGQIQSSSSSIAHEVITSDAQAVVAAPVVYHFQGDVDPTLVTQSFQIQLILNKDGKTPTAQFKTAGTANAIVMLDKNGVVIPAAAYTVSTPQISNNADGTSVLYANVTFPQAAGTVWQTPTVRFNDTTTNAGAQAATVTGVYTVAGGLIQPCVNPTPSLGVSVKEFANVTTTAMATDATNGNSANEHTRPGSVNDGILLSFPTNISVALVAATTRAARVDASTQNTKFVTNATAVGTTDIYLSNVAMNLGTINLSQDALGTDSGSNSVYALNPTGTPASAGLTFVNNAVTKTNGAVEAKNFSVTIASSQGFAVGSTITLGTTPGGAAVGGLTATVTATTGNSITLTSNTLTAAQLLAPLYVTYTVPGTTVIPASTFTGTATLVKAPDSVASNYFTEQSESCSKPLAALTGTLKIDVRNYASTQQVGGWTSVIRIINPEESNTATLYAQLIRADGSYGNWGTLGTLAPRGAVNLSNKQIETLLTNAPVNNGVGYVGVAGGANAQDVGDRLRISAEGVSALKVQNYLWNPTTKNFIEASGSQGVDFDADATRAPGNAQLNDQDAQRNIAK